MLDVFSSIDSRIDKLKSSEFCEWLRSARLSDDPFGFVPSQAFLVFGFRDLLRELEVSNPTNEFEELLNEHCKEDSDHWKWYLNDLKQLGFHVNSWGPSFTDIIQGMWSEDSYTVRSLIYTSMYYIRRAESPAISLVIIEVLEGAFEAFIESMRVPVEQSGYFKDLQYYGKLHTEKEESHTLWTGPENQLLKYPLTAEQKQFCLTAVDEIFSLFDKTFAHWYKSRSRYSRHPESLQKNLSPEIKLRGEKLEEVLA